MKSLNLCFLVMVYFTSKEAVGQDLTCYSCQYSYHPDVEAVCVMDPDHPNNIPGTVACSTDEGRTCTIYSQVDKSNGLIRSFTRGCEVYAQDSGCTEDIYFITCLEKCTTDLCNNSVDFPTKD